MVDKWEGWHVRLPELEDRVRDLESLVRYMANTLHIRTIILVGVIGECVINRYVEKPRRRLG